MLLSKNYLSSKLNNFNISNEKLEEELNNLGIEVETDDNLYVPGLKLGYVKECDKIPETKLSKAIVDLGDSETQILCGCPSIKKGIYVIVATVGTTLPIGIKIGKRKMIGHESNGMICGLDEIGFNPKLIPDEWKDKILHIPKKLAEKYLDTRDANEIVALNDEIIEISLTANRNDIAGQNDVVEELSIFHSKKRAKKQELELTYNHNVSVESDYIKGLYSARIETGEYDKYNKITFELIKLGVKPTLKFQDIMTYMTLNTGVVFTGFNEEITVNSDNEIRVNDKLIGLEPNQEPNPNFITLSVLDKQYSRFMSRKEKLTNIFVTKSLRGICSSKIEIAYRYFRDFIANHLPQVKISKLIEHKNTPNISKPVTTTVEYINELLGTELTPNKIHKILSQKYECSLLVNVIKVTPPCSRFDINIPADIAEEVAILMGYDQIAPKAYDGIQLNQAKGEYSELSKIKSTILSFGFNETVTYNLVNKNDNDLWNPFNLENQVQVLKPISQEREFMRNSLLFQNLRTYDYNKKQGNKNIKLFELANISTLNSSELHLCLVCGQEESINGFTGEKIKTDFYYLKSIFINLMNKLGIKNNLEMEYINPNQNILHPNKTAVFKNNINEVVAYIGETHPFMKNKNFKGLNVMEVNIDVLLKNTKVKIKPKPISQFSTIKKDFSFFLGKDESVKDLFKQIKELNYVKDLEVFDLFEKDGEKSIAFSIYINSNEKTFTSEEIQDISTKVTNIIVSQNGQLR